MEEPFGTLFVSIPTLLDPSLSPDSTHIVHVFSPDWIDNWKVRSARPCLQVHNAMLHCTGSKGPCLPPGSLLLYARFKDVQYVCKSLRHLCHLTGPPDMYSLSAPLFPPICRGSVWQSMSRRRRRLQTAW